MPFVAASLLLERRKTEPVEIDSGDRYPSQPAKFLRRRGKKNAVLVYAVSMDAVEPDWTTKKVLDTLAGIEIGVIGGVVMLFWLAISAPLAGYSWWFFLNLFASHSYSARALGGGPGMATVSGVAIQMAAAGLVGAVTGFTTPGGRLYGLAVTLVWYILCYGFFWKRYSPLLPVYAPQPLLAVAFFLYGSVLGWHRHFANQLYKVDGRAA